MIYDFDIPTPALTLKSAPVRTSMPLVKGTIVQMGVFVPPGSNGLAHLKILYGINQLFPSNEQGDFSASGILFTWPEDIVLDTDPVILTALTWNDDDTYPHTVHVRIAVTPATGNSNINDVLAQVQQLQATQ